MATTSDLSFILELARTHEPQDPYAFRFEPQTYTVRTEGGGREVIEIDWGPKLLADLEALRDPNPEPALIQRIGDMLARVLERASWTSRAGDIARVHDAGGHVFITLRSSATELYALPWELLTLPGRGQHLGELPRVLLRYERPETHETIESPSRPEGGRILLAWSAAAGAVPAAAHETALRAACASAHPDGDDALEVLAHASVRGIVDALTRAKQDGRPFAVLHLLCHGGRSGQTFGLVLDGDTGPATVPANTWRTMLAPRAGDLRLVVLSACEGGNAGRAGNHLGSVAQALHAAGLQAVVASRRALSRAGSIALTESLYEGLLCEHQSLEQALLKARSRLALDTKYLDWAAVQLCARAKDGDDSRPFVFRPYRGLLAFEPDQAAFFHGREAERDKIRSSLETLVRTGKPRLVVVAGASGTGKSSLVRAGAVPDILATREGKWEHAVLRPGDDPLGTLEAALDARHDDTRPLLLVIDQFEELFTHTQDREVRLAFTQRLWSLVSDATDVCCVLALRIDFLGRCGELRLDDEGTRLDAVAFDDAHRVMVAQMSPEQLRAAIVRPARSVGLSLDDGLAERIVAEVGMEPGGLPLMQYTLDQLWQKRRGHELSRSAYEELGGVIGALERRADAVLEELSDDEVQHARRMLTLLVGLGDDHTGDTRRRVPIEQLWPDERVERRRAEAVLRRFVDERLLVRDDRMRGGATVEIAHEALIRRWARLQEWLGDERERTIGRYIVLEQIRESSREQTYLGYDPQLDRRVTLKLLRVGRGGAKERKRLQDQARALARLSHPNVQAVYDVGVARGHVYIAMERVDAQPLRAWLEQSRPWTEIATVLCSVAEALEAAHTLGLCHRAFNPGVVSIDAEGVARVGDFALDRHAETTDVGRSAQTFAARAQARRTGPQVAISDEDPSLMSGPSRLTTGTNSVGDPTYMPPEQVRGHAMGPAGDQYSFCVMLYQALYGELPFPGHGMAAFVAAQTDSRQARVRNVAIPGSLYKVLIRGLAGEPDERWPSMEVLAGEIMRAVRFEGRRAVIVRAGVVVLLGVLGAVALGARAWLAG